MSAASRSMQRNKYPPRSSNPPLAALGLAVGFLVVLLSACQQGGGGVSSAELVISPGGGSFTEAGITIEVPAGAAASELTLNLDKVEDSTSLPADVAYLSPVYRFSGPLEQIKGELLVSFEIPDQALKDAGLSGEDLAGSFFATVLEDYDLETGEGEAFPGYTLPVEVNLEAKTATVHLNLGEDLVMISAGKISAPSADRPGQLSDRKSIGLRLGRSWTLRRTLVSQQGNFQAIISGNLDLNQVDALLELLERDKLLLEELGLQFTARTAYPIVVNLKDLDSKDGNFTGSYFANSREINIHSRFFQGSGLDELTKATAGHELFHLAQSLYYPQDYSYGRNFDAFDWLDEASATWFEAVALSDPSWTPNVAQTNSEFILTPLNMPQESSADHGYGASWYLRYLTGEAGLGNLFVPEIYHAAFNSGGNNNPSSALEAALETHNTTSRDTWPAFLATYLLRPEDLGGTLDTRRFQDRLLLVAEPAESSGNTSLTFKPGPNNDDEIKRYNPDYTIGYPDMVDSYPQVTLQKSLGQLTAASLTVSVLSNDALTGEVLAEPGVLKVEGFLDGIFSGIAVFGIPAGADPSAAVPLAGPEGSTGYLGREGSVVEVKGFGPGGTYDRVVLIFFNADPTAVKIEQETLTATLTYQPLSQCLDFEGELLIDSAALSTPPCQAYENCPNPDFSCSEGCGMGEGDEPSEGAADCSLAPAYCFEDAVISDLLEYTQPGTLLPFTFLLEEVNGTTQAGFEFDYRENAAAEAMMIHLYNHAQVDLAGLQTNLVEGTLRLTIPYGTGALSLSGTLGESEGSGLFSLSHPALGNFVTGSWTAMCRE